MKSVAVRPAALVAVLAHMQAPLSSPYLDRHGSGIIIVRRCPHPVPDFRQVLPVLGDVMLMLDELVLNRLF